MGGGEEEYRERFEKNEMNVGWWCLRRGKRQEDEKRKWNNGFVEKDGEALHGSRKFEEENKKCRIGKRKLGKERESNHVVRERQKCICERSTKTTSGEREERI